MLGIRREDGVLDNDGWCDIALRVVRQLADLHASRKREEEGERCQSFGALLSQ
jgi:hypothetical protein